MEHDSVWKRKVWDGLFEFPGSDYLLFANIWVLLANPPQSFMYFSPMHIFISQSGLGGIQSSTELAALQYTFI